MSLGWRNKVDGVRDKCMHSPMVKLVLFGNKSMRQIILDQPVFSYSVQSAIILLGLITSLLVT